MEKTFDSQCEALSRKTGQRCPHKTSMIYSNVIGHRPVMDEKQYSITGEGVCLCRGHSAAYSPKKEPLRLIKGCFLKASNRFGYGTRVSDRGGSVEGDRAENFLQWGAVELHGNVPENLRRIFSENVEVTRGADPKYYHVRAGEKLLPSCEQYYWGHSKNTQNSLNA